MKIELKKFGTVLVSRQAGREAYLAFSPRLAEAQKGEEVAVDFSGVVAFTPSWGDEFLRPLAQRYGHNLVLTNTTNPSVVETLKILEEVNQLQFNRR